MNIKEIIEKYTKDGVTDYDLVNKEIEAINQDNLNNQIGASKSKLKSKFQQEKEELEKKIAELEEKTSKTDDEKSTKDKELEELKKRFDEMEALKKRESAIKEFKNKAKESKLNEALIDTLIKTGANLEEVDIEQLKQFDIEKSGDDITNPDKDKEEKENQSILDRIRKNRR